MELGRLLERVLRDSRVLDVEALCIAAGDRVWDVRTHVAIVDDSGALADVVFLAAIASLRHFRRADVSVVDGVLVVHPYDERTPVPLSLHHTPLSFSFAIFGASVAHLRARDAAAAKAASTAARTARDFARARRAATRKSRNVGDHEVPDDADEQDDDHNDDDDDSSVGDAPAGGDTVLLLDPTHREEQSCEGTIIVSANAHAEICAVHKLGGAPVELEELMGACSAAGALARAACRSLEAALRSADEAQLRADAARIAAALRGNEVAGVVTATTVSVGTHSTSRMGDVRRVLDVFGPVDAQRAAAGPESAPPTVVGPALAERLLSQSIARLRTGDSASAPLSGAMTSKSDAGGSSSHSNSRSGAVPAASSAAAAVAAATAPWSLDAHSEHRNEVPETADDDDEDEDVLDELLGTDSRASGKR